MPTVHPRISFVSSSGNAAAPLPGIRQPHDIHWPRVPHPRFAGTIGCGVSRRRVGVLGAGRVRSADPRHTRPPKLPDRTLIPSPVITGPVETTGTQRACATSPATVPVGPLRGASISCSRGAPRGFRSWSLAPAVLRARCVRRAESARTCWPPSASLLAPESPAGSAPDSLDVCRPCSANSASWPRSLSSTTPASRPSGGVRWTSNSGRSGRAHHANTAPIQRESPVDQL